MTTPSKVGRAVNWYLALSMAAPIPLLAFAAADFLFSRQIAEWACGPGHYVELYTATLWENCLGFSRSQVEIMILVGFFGGMACVAAFIAGLILRSERAKKTQAARVEISGWSKEMTSDSLPIWRGRDSIYDRNLQSQETKFMPALIALALGFVLVFVSPTLTLICWAVAAALAVFGRAKATNADFIGHKWELRAKAGGVSLSVGSDREARRPIGSRQPWAVSLDQIATVEADVTSKWETSREYLRILPGNEPRHPVPASEWQTFLVLADQSRRVVHIANGDREGAVTLAASIRAHVEAARAASAPAPVSPAMSSPSGEGFDL